MSGDMRHETDAASLSQTDLIAREEFSQSGADHCHRLRIARSKAITGVLKQCDADLAIVVVGAIGKAVRRRRVAVNGPRPLLGDDVRPTRDGTRRADLRQAGTMKGEQAEWCDHLDFREGSRVQERQGDKASANGT